MTAAIFLVIAFALMSAAGGRRGTATALFVLALVGSALWLQHLMSDSLKLAF